MAPTRLSDNSVSLSRAGLPRLDARQPGELGSYCGRSSSARTLRETGTQKIEPRWVAMSASMDVARDAAERGDWSVAEQALLDVQERSARLLRELSLRGGSVEPPKQPPGPGETG
jgi:hypothetical protein